MLPVSNNIVWEFSYYIVSTSSGNNEKLTGNDLTVERERGDGQKRQGAVCVCVCVSSDKWRQRCQEKAFIQSFSALGGRDRETER